MSLRFWPLVFCILISSKAYAEQNLCKKDETVFFSCKIARSGKIVSLCADRRMLTWSANPPYDPFLTYRFGSTGKTELEYPKKREDSTDKFRYLHMASKANMGNYNLEEVSFQVSNVEYAVFDNDSPADDETGKSRSSAGVRITRKNQKALELQCSDRSVSKLSQLQGFIQLQEEGR